MSEGAPPPEAHDVDVDVDVVADPSAPTAPEVPAGAVDAHRLAVGFAEVLRSAGVTVPVGSLVTYVQALGSVGIDDRHHVYWAGRATLLTRPEETPAYDAAFARFWDRHAQGPQPAAHPAPKQVVELAVDDDDLPAGDGDDDTGRDESEERTRLRFSSEERLRRKDFAECSDDELDEVRRLMADLRLVGASRPSRRLRPTSRHSARPDLRRTMRAALRTGGEPVVRRHRHRSTRPRRVVLLLDVSGSMDPYARALLHVVHVAVANRSRVEAFALGTRLTRLTRELSTHDPDAALAAAGRAAPDWSGGTRLGEALRTFNDTWGQRGMARGAVVVVLSDGWDRGDPAVLAEQMQRLTRVAHRVVWVNPLKASPGYAPLARGMAAALPFVDAFVEGHSADAMEQLAREIARESR